MNFFSRKKEPTFENSIFHSIEFCKRGDGYTYFFRFFDPIANEYLVSRVHRLVPFEIDVLLQEQLGKQVLSCDFLEGGSVFHFEGYTLKLGSTELSQN